MRNTLLKIGEMAELNHVSTQTLRLYSKNKLLEPQYMDPETGYRYYTLEQCAKLDLVRALKSWERSARYLSFHRRNDYCRYLRNRSALYRRRSIILQ